MRLPIFLIGWLFICGIFAQGQYQKVWRWAYGAGLDFSTAPPTVLPNNGMEAYTTSVSHCDPVTGKLLFYTDGFRIYNGNGEVSGVLLGMSQRDIAILPVPQQSTQFYLVGTGAYLVYDAAANAGKGGVLRTGTTPFVNATNRITAIKHCFNGEYWLVVLEKYPFHTTIAASRLKTNGTFSQVIRSTFQTAIGNYTGALVANQQGTQLAFSNYREDGNHYLVDFDKKCGVFTNLRALPRQTGWDYPFGLCFSPSGKYLYASYSVAQSYLLQYPVNNLNNFKVVASSDQNFNQMMLGPDQQLYITTHIGGIPSEKIDLVRFPEEEAPGCNYVHDHLRLKGNTSFHMPSFVVAHSGGGCVGSAPTIKMEIPSSLCSQQAGFFKADYPIGTYESARWHFGDGSSFDGDSTCHVYQNPGKYDGFVVMKYCSEYDTLPFSVLVDPAISFHLGPDTTLCAGDSLQVGSGLAFGQHLWNDGSTSTERKISTPGIWILTVTQGVCKASDTLVLKKHPSLWTTLGSEYFICEEEGDLVLLDAGKGFAHYLWTPTGDTSQWIVVGKKGAYWVLVEDFTGCKAEDGTVVHTRCDMHIHFPNAFSPNNDGLNDYFGPVGKDIIDLKMKVYDRWGALVWTGEGPQAQWDGKVNGSPAPAGVYSYQAVVMGAKKKVIYRKVFTGNCTLLN